MWKSYSRWEALFTHRMSLWSSWCLQLHPTTHETLRSKQFLLQQRHIFFQLHCYFFLSLSLGFWFIFLGQTEIKRVLEAACGFEIEKVRTLNVKGKKKWRSGRLIATRPDYKKAYVTLKENSSISPALFQSRSVEEGKMAISRWSKLKLARRRESSFFFSTGMLDVNLIMNSLVLEIKDKLRCELIKQLWETWELPVMSSDFQKINFSSDELALLYCIFPVFDWRGGWILIPCSIQIFGGDGRWKKKNL